MPATNNVEEITTQSTEPVKNATIREPSVRGRNNSPQNQPEPPEKAAENKDMVTIPKADYDKIMAELQQLRGNIRETYVRIDSMLHVQKQQLSQSLNQTVRSHNLIADMEGVKDSITGLARI